MLPEIRILDAHVGTAALGCPVERSSTGFFTTSANPDSYPKPTLNSTTAQAGVALTLMCGSGLCRLHLAAYAFHVTKHAQNIATENLLDVTGAVAAIEQSLCNFRQIGGRVDPLRRGSAHSVEIRAQAHVVHSRNLRDVVDVIDKRLQRRPRNLGHPPALDAVHFDVIDFLALSFALRHVGIHGGGLVFVLGFSGIEKVLVNEAI